MFHLFQVTSRVRFLWLKIAPLIVLSTFLDFLGMVLVYPLINLLGGLESDNNEIIQYLYKAIDWLGVSRTGSAILSYILFIFIIKAIFQILYRWLASKGVMVWLVDIRKDIYNAIYISNFTEVNEDRARLINSLTSQSELASGAIYQSFQLWQSILVAISGIILANIISWELFIVLITIGSLIAIILRITMAMSLKYGEELAELNKGLFSIIGQAINSYRYLKSTNSHYRMYRDFTPIIDRIKDTQMRFTVLNAITSSVTEPITIMVIFLLFFIGKSMGIESSILIMQAVVMYRVFSRVMPLSVELQGFNKSIASLNYIDNLITGLNESVELNEGTPINNVKKVEFKNVSFDYNGNSTLENINLKLLHPSLTVIMGESGSGKSTLLNLITGLLTPSVGEININGESMDEINFNTYRSKIGLLNQEPTLFNMSLRENLSLRNANMSDYDIESQIKELKLESIFYDGKINLDRRVNELSTNLSGGQKQRLAYIRELNAMPDLLILDEPTSALDKESKSILLNQINKLKKKIIIIAVTHDDNLLEIADNVHLIKNGQLSIEN